jgi:hypothetical protein
MMNFTTSMPNQSQLQILTRMYDENSRQIAELTHSLQVLIESNNEIRQTISQLPPPPTNQPPPQQATLTQQSLRYLLPRRARNTVTNNTSYPLEEIIEYFFQPIQIYPSQLQIENATRNVRYCDISRPINTQCPIAMEDFGDNDMVTVIRQCGHIFFTNHIMNWFRSNCHCPVCRYDIREYNATPSNAVLNGSS